MSTLSLINFRDLAYLKGKDGRQLKANLIYRGPSLLENRLTKEDKKILDDMHIQHLIDFRGIEEAEFHGFDYVPKGAELTNISALELEDKQNNPAELSEISEEEHLRRVEWLHQAYQQMPFNNHAYAYVFKCLRNYETAIYMHCSVGKDRTGVISALVLKLMGFDDETIFEDYLLSKKNWLAVYQNEGKQEEELSPLLLVKKEWIEDCFKSILKRYSSFEEYFSSEYGLEEKEIEEIRKYYLG